MKHRNPLRMIAALAAIALLPAMMMAALPDSAADLIAAPVAASMLAVASVPMIANMPIKVEGDIVATGDPLPDLGKEKKKMVASGFCRPATLEEQAAMGAERPVDLVSGNSESGQSENGSAPDLGDRVQTLLAEGRDFDGLNMKDARKLLGKDYKSVTRADLDAALSLIVVDGSAGGQPDDAAMASIIETIDVLESDLVDPDTGDIDIDQLKKELDADAMPDDATIKAAIAKYQADQTEA